MSQQKNKRSLNDPAFVDELVGPWLAAGYGSLDGGWFGLTKDNMDLLKQRLGKGRPTQLVVVDRSGGEVLVQPTRHDALLVVTDQNGDIIEDMDRMLTEAIREYW